MSDSFTENGDFVGKSTGIEFFDGDTATGHRGGCVKAAKYILAFISEGIEIEAQAIDKLPASKSAAVGGWFWSAFHKVLIN